MAKRTIKQKKPSKNELPEPEAPQQPTGMKSFLSTLIILVITLAAALAIAGIFSSVDMTPSPKQEAYDEKDFIFPLPTTRAYELTEVDLFSLSDWNSYQVTVKGVALGDTLEQVEEKLGPPDDVEVFNPVVTTLIYYDNDENKQHALLFYVANKQVRRIFVKAPFNDQLKGSTKVTYDLRGIYDKFGVPPEQEDVYKQRIFEYHKQGLEIYHKNKQMTAFALVPPGYNGGQDETKSLSEFA
ncbi:hypothetical protein J4410_07190 [Candidatus Woesearchaeota archaeon]|nr:hypothetical protein [Candidatus Woesearchaeota archaeon]